MSSLEIIKQYLEPKSILDIGCNTGQFYREIKQIFPDAYYYLIDGNDQCEEAIKDLNVDYSIALLSDSIKSVDFYIRKSEPTCTGNSIYRENTSFYDDDQILIKKRTTTTLEHLLTDKTFDLIKIDVQGSEMDIINGAIEIIKQASGIILEVSLVEYNQGAPLKSTVIEFMNNLNFKQTEIIGHINHPISHEPIQEDILFINKKLS
jgi:FkbM family methyltransferase